MQYTTHGLKKPELSDPVLITDINYNADLIDAWKTEIDTRIPSLSASVVPCFDTTTGCYEATSTYLKGTVGSSADCALELGELGSGNRNCFIDFHSRDSPSDYTFRIIQYSYADEVVFWNALNNKFVFRYKIGIGIAPTYDLQLTNDSAAKPSTNTWTVTSDIRAKTEITDADLDICLNIIKNLPLKRFRWKDEYLDVEQAPDRHKIGWIADDVEKFFPKSVEKRPFIRNKKIKRLETDPATGETREIDDIESEVLHTDFKYLNSDQIIAAMYGAVQKLITIVEDLQKEVEKLKKKATSRA